MGKLNREEAKTILVEMTKGESLLRHARSVELVMEAYANKLDEDAEEWAIAGMLHDADYEAFPDQHPNVIVAKLRELREDKLAHAISAHYTKWGKEYTNTLDKALVACDELTGFVIACAQVRPEGINQMAVKSVKKKLKQKSFAASVDREEISKGIEMLQVNEDEHIAFIIDVLEKNKAELKIG
jgi:predicted hydrolase (HD superfamily)